MLQNLARIPTGVLLVEDTLPYALGNRPRFVLDHVWSRFRREVSYDVRADLRGRYTLGPLTVRIDRPVRAGRAAAGIQRDRDDHGHSDGACRCPRCAWLANGAVAVRARPRSVASAGEEDATVRSYRHGDDMRRVHWRATAHHGELMVRREEQPWQSRATLLLDTRVDAHAGHGPDSSLEYAVSAAASVGVHLPAAATPYGWPPTKAASVSGAWHDPGGDPPRPRCRCSTLSPSSRRHAMRRWAAGPTCSAAPARQPACWSGYSAASTRRRRRWSRSCGTARRLRSPIMLDAASWTSATPGVLAAEEQRLAETAQILRRAGWGVVTVARG